MEQTIIHRGRGAVVRLLVEIDASQARELDRVLAIVGMSKADAIQAAINIWLDAVTPKGRHI